MKRRIEEKKFIFTKNLQKYILSLYIYKTESRLCHRVILTLRMQIAKTMTILCLVLVFVIGLFCIPSSINELVNALQMTDNETERNADEFFPFDNLSCIDELKVNLSSENDIIHSNATPDVVEDNEVKKELQKGDNTSTDGKLKQEKLNFGGYLCEEQQPQQQHLNSGCYPRKVFVSWSRVRSYLVRNIGLPIPGTLEIDSLEVMRCREFLYPCNHRHQIYCHVTVEENREITMPVRDVNNEYVGNLTLSYVQDKKCQCKDQMPFRDEIDDPPYIFEANVILY